LEGQDVNPTARHECLIYEGSPEKHLPGLAITIRQKLSENYRCLYLNNARMVDGIKAWLSSLGTDVASEIASQRLVLSSDQAHLQSSDGPGVSTGAFDSDLMLKKLEDGLDQALNEGYRGLWATGDMLWELGSEQNLDKLLAYEWQLDELLIKRPELCGICQYHIDVLPRDIIRQGFLAHPTLYLNETLSRANPHYLKPQSYTADAAAPALDRSIFHHCGVKYAH
jgi:hypothetical protein